MTSPSDENQAFLNIIKTQLGIVADISRAEGLLYGPLIEGQTTVIAHVHPHSVAPAYLKNYTGKQISRADMPVVVKTLRSGRRQRGSQGVFGDGASVIIEAWPLFAPAGAKQVIGAVSIDTSLLENERQRRRSRTFQRALRQLQAMLTRGLLKNAETLSPFGEPEGLMVADKEGYIRYASGVAASLYRRLGYLDTLVGRQLQTLATQDDKLFRKAVASLECVEQETEDGGRHWVKKAIPLLPQPAFTDRLLASLNRPKPQPPAQAGGALIILRDITQERRQEQEIRVKNAMIQEIHHRVKNNLQTIAALLRIQSRRVNSREAALALQDAVKRILSVAVIHEFLSDQDVWTINIKDVCQRIITQTRQSIVSPEINIAFELSGPAIWLPARQATACALVINELLQNALEHGFGEQLHGTISINLADEGDWVIIHITDNGHGLPDSFDLNAPNSLGLQIAGTLVKEDLQGQLDFATSNGTTARISFPKAIFGDESGWSGS